MFNVFLPGINPKRTCRKLMQVLYVISLAYCRDAQITNRTYYSKYPINNVIYFCYKELCRLSLKGIDNV
jgi:hypothetical protein